MSEEWRVCKEGYEVSNLGNVRRIKDGKLMRQYQQKSGYMAVWLRINGWVGAFMVHRLVAMAFCKPEKWCEVDRIDHINTDRADNRAENLRWVYAKGNANNPTTKINMSNAQKKRRK